MKRERLPDERESVGRHFNLPYIHKNGETDVMGFYFHVGLYPDRRIGEVFIKADKTGTLVSGVMDYAAISMSIGLQHGMPLDVFLGKMRHTRFQPSGFTKDKDFPSCTSPLDLLAQWLESKFIHACPSCKERTQLSYEANKTYTCSCNQR